VFTYQHPDTQVREPVIDVGDHLVHRSRHNVASRHSRSTSKQLRMYYGSGTVDRIAVADNRWTQQCMQQQVPSGRDVYSHQMAALFCVKWRHGRHLETLTSYQKQSDSVNRRVFTWKTLGPHLIIFIAIRFWTTEQLGGGHNKKKKNNNKMS